MTGFTTIVSFRNPAWRNLTLGFILTWISACVSSGPQLPSYPLSVTERQQIDAARRQPLKTPFLWEIRKANSRCYLLGTFHRGIAISELPVQTVRRLWQSSTYIMESDPNRHQNQLDLTNQTIFRESCPCLDDELTDAAWSKLRLRLGDQQNSTKRLQPSAAGFLYKWFLFVSNFPLPLSSMDQELHDEAKQLGKKLVFLEDPISFDTQSFSSSSSIHSTEELEALLNRNERELVEELREEFIEFYAKYRSGNMQKVESILAKQLDSESYESLVSKRNKLWMPALEEAAGKGECFVAVGLGHMTGQDSLLVLLKEAGFSTKRIDKP